MDFFKKQAQSFLSEDKASKPKPDQSSSDAPKTSTGTGTGKEEVPSYSELMGSANVLLDAAKQQMGGGAAKEGGGGGKPMDTAKLAGAAEDVLDAAKHYGKLEGTAYGGYVKKAEDYLHTYQSRDVDVTPEKKEAAAGELKAAAEDVKAKSEVPDKVVDAVQDKIEAAAPPAEKSAAAPPPPKPSDE